MDIWNSPDGPRWVQFRLIQSGSSMNVLVLDQNRNIVRTGNATGPGSFTPYTLVEVRSHSEKIPSESRGRWMLAVACWKAPLDVGAPIRFTASPAARSANTLPCTLIRWHDKGKLAAATSGFDLSELDDLEIRIAELGAPAQFDAAR